MADPSSSGQNSTSITDLDIDALSVCTSYLNLRDVSNLAMSCSCLHRAAYSDSIWRSLYRQEWPQVALLGHQSLSMREAYLSRRASLLQFKYADPLICDFYATGKSPNHILMDKNTVMFTQASFIRSLNIDDLITRSGFSVNRGRHNARITCMRLFSLNEDDILVTSSSDHFIRLWLTGGSRCFKGHNGPVCTLSDKLLGDGTEKVFASGGEDKTVRLWSVTSSGKRGQHALKATLYGHNKAVSLMAVAGHKTSLLVSISKNGKVTVWDAAVASLSSFCAGTTVPASPIGMKCHESLFYVAAGSSIVAVDLRTMRRVFTIVQQAEIHSFELLPSKFRMCTGGTNRAMLWDVRGASDSSRTEPTVELDGHICPVKHLHMDAHKVVTGGLDDPCVKVWEADTGTQTNSLICSDPSMFSDMGCSAMAVDGYRIVTASGDNQENYSLRFRDFKMATRPVSMDPEGPSSGFSKFWGSQTDSDPEDPDWL